MKTIATILSTLVIASLLQACSDSEGRNAKQSNSNEIPVNIIPLAKKSVSTPIEASGQFTTDDETYLAFKTGGVIDKIFKKEGDAIKKGELLATLNLTEINAGVAQAQLAFEKAQRDLNRVANLYRDSVATLEQYQNAQTGLDVATNQLEAAKFNRSYSEIRALSDGYILRKLANAGQVISSGSTVFQTNGAKQGDWKLKVAVSDKAWTRISKGDDAVVTLDANTKSFKAIVSRKSEGIDPLTGSFIIELSLLEKSNATLASGMFGKATITPSQTEQVWVIPYDALLDGDAQSGFVFVTDDNAKAKKAKVSIASITENEVIVNGGLENGKALITTGSAYLKDGSPIKIINR